MNLKWQIALIDCLLSFHFRNEAILLAAILKRELVKLSKLGGFMLVAVFVLQGKTPMRMKCRKEPFQEVSIFLFFKCRRRLKTNFNLRNQRTEYFM